MKTKMHDPEIMKSALQSLRLKYVVMSFKSSVPYVLDNLSSFKQGHLQRISQVAEAEGDSQMKKAIGAHSLENTEGNTLGIAGIIVVSTFLDQVSDILGINVNEICKYGSIISQDMNWAEGVRSASNYVRHIREWQSPGLTYVQKIGKLVQSPKETLMEVLDSRGKRNAKNILKLGFQETDLLAQGTNIAYRIADKLDLTNVSKTNVHFEEWVQEVQSHYLY